MQEHTRRAVVTALRLAIAHHPLCGFFDGDVFGRRLRVCSGCVLTWPAFLAALPWALLAPARWSWDPWAMTAVAVVLGLPQASTLLWRGSRWWRAVVKVVGGVGFALLSAALAWWPVHLGWRLGAAALLLVAILAFLSLRMRSILAVCDSCPWGRDWGRCPGFAAERNG